LRFIVDAGIVCIRVFISFSKDRNVAGVINVIIVSDACIVISFSDGSEA